MRRLHLLVVLALAAALTPPPAGADVFDYLPCDLTEGDAAPRHPATCCDEAVTDPNGRVVLPPGATDVEEGNMDLHDRGSTADLYPGAGLTDLFYPSVACPWSVGGNSTVPDWSLDDELHDAGIPANGEQIAAELDLTIEQVVPTVVAGRPTEMQQLIEGGKIPRICPAVLVTCAPPARDVDPAAIFGGRDVIFVHGFEGERLKDALNGVPDALTRWPDDAAEFTQSSGYWKQDANAIWDDYVDAYLKAPDGDLRNRYLTVAWSSNQWLAYGIHAFLSQVTAAIRTGSGVVPTAGSTDTSAFCANGCVIVSHSTGGLLVSSAMAIATNPATSALFGDLSEIPRRMRAHVAFAPAYSGSHYATVAAAVGWLATVPAGVCELGRWLIDSISGSSLNNCGALTTFATTIAGSVLTDLAVPVTQAIWHPIALSNPSPVPTLIVAGGHPTSLGVRTIPQAVKALSPLAKLLLHHGYDDGTLTMDSQCATTTSWRDWPSSYVVRPSILDVSANATLVANQLPPLVTSRAFDLGSTGSRSLMYYLDHVVGARAFTPAFWKAVGQGRTFQHFLDTRYWAAAACTPYVSPTGMVQQVERPVAKAGADSLSRWPGHHTFLIAAADHQSPVKWPAATRCYEQTWGLGLDCPDNQAEARLVTDPVVYADGLVHPSYQNAVREQVWGRYVRFRLFGRRFTWWIVKRTYHVLENFETKTAADYVRDYVLKP